MTNDKATVKTHCSGTEQWCLRPDANAASAAALPQNVGGDAGQTPRSTNHQCPGAGTDTGHKQAAVTSCPGGEQDWQKGSHQAHTQRLRVMLLLQPGSPVINWSLTLVIS